MEVNRKILIITDNSEQMRDLTAKITAVINSRFERYQVIATDAENFSTVELLPAQAFFLGCESKESFTNSYIEELFAHINLAGRTCGIFSADDGAVKYLEGLVSSTDVTVGKPFLVNNDTAEDAVLQNWVQGILQNTV